METSWRAGDKHKKVKITERKCDEIVEQPPKTQHRKATISLGSA